MATKKISALTAKDTILGTDYLPVVSAAVTYKVQAEHLLMTQTVTQTRYNNIIIAMSATRLGGSKDPGYAVFLDDGAGSQGVFTYWFDDAIEEELYFTCQIPQNWREGSDIVVAANWVPKINGVGVTTVSWGLEYTIATFGAVFPATTIIANNTPYTLPATELVASKFYMTEIGTISGVGHTLMSTLCCRIFRDATGALEADTYAGDAGLLQVVLAYEVDSLGSVTPYSKEGP